MLCTLQLQGKTDEGFVKGAFKLLRDHLGLKLATHSWWFEGEPLLWLSPLVRSPRSCLID
jgi:hypothetical protein